MQTVGRGLAAVAIALLVGACAHEGGERREGAPALWRVSDADSELFLFGTLHVLPSGVVWWTPAIERAMDAATTTITEADVSSARAQEEAAKVVRRLGLNPPGETLASALGAERWEALRSVAFELDVDADRLAPLRPWLALLTLAQAAMEREGLAQANGVEPTIVRRATEQGDAIEHFETATEQIEIFAALAPDDLLADVDRELGELRNFREILNGMLDAWLAGDAAALESATLARMRDESPAAYRALITERNDRWVEALRARLDGEGSAFVAVGAAHLLGADGVPELLRRKGFSVERIQ